MGDPLFTIRPRKYDPWDMPAEYGREHLTPEGVERWLHDYYPCGAFEIIDERDGLEACIYEIGGREAHHVDACDCRRPSCPDSRTLAEG